MHAGSAKLCYYSFPLVFFPAGFLPATAATVPVSKDGYFVLAAPEQTGDILLVGKNYKQGNGNSESTVKGLFFIEDKEYENRERHTGEYRA